MTYTPQQIRSFKEAAKRLIDELPNDAPLVISVFNTISLHGNPQHRKYFDEVNTRFFQEAKQAAIKLGATS